MGAPPTDFKANFVASVKKQFPDSLSTLLSLFSLLESISVTQTGAIVGGNARLVCNTTAPSQKNPVTLVIWYKNEGDAVYR
jgi:hypothetical protein